jgi:hypothetical protein
MSLDEVLAEAIREDDPRLRALNLNALVHDAERLRIAASRARAKAIFELSTSGVPGVEIARLLGLTRGRVAQILGGRQNKE